LRSSPYEGGAKEAPSQKAAKVKKPPFQKLLRAFAAYQIAMMSHEAD